MVFASLPTTLITRRPVPYSLVFISRATNSCPPSSSKVLRVRACVFGEFDSSFHHKPLKSLSPKPRGSLSVSSDDKSSASDEEDDQQALETVLKLHTAFDNNNVNELSSVIGEECRCICSFFPFFQKFHGKKQVLEFFCYLIEKLGNNTELVVQPTHKDGMTVGIAWRLECSKTHVPLGKGFSFYTCHVYQGKVLIRNVEMFIEPLLHLQPFRGGMVGSVKSIADKLYSKWPFKLEAKVRTCFWLTLFFFMAILLFTLH